MADSKAEHVRSNYLFDSFGFLECVWSSPLAKTDLMIFAQANTSHGIQFKTSPYITDYPRLLKLFNSIVSSQLIHQQKIENDFGKIDNISQRNSKMRMRALVVWRENCERKHLFNAQSVQELGAYGYKRHFKVKRVDCEFSNIECKSKVCKTECLAAAANARARAKEQETAASLTMTDNAMHRKEETKATKKRRAQAEVSAATECIVLSVPATVSFQQSAIVAGTINSNCTLC